MCGVPITHLLKRVVSMELAKPHHPPMISDLLGMDWE